MIKKIIKALNNLDPNLTPEEIADILWLANKMSQNSQTNATTIINSITDNKAPFLENPDLQKLKPFYPNKTNFDNSKPLKTEKKEINETSTGISPINISVNSTLSTSLSISRSLRPLKYRARSKRNFVIDEEKTVNQIAEQDLWAPIMKPNPSYRFDMAYVVDNSDSMIIWSKVIKEFEIALKGLGAFRKLEKWAILTNNETPKLYKQTPYNLEHSQKRSYKELCGLSDISKIIFVVTDCISISWYNGEVAKILTEWGKNNIVVIVQVLPESLWIRTALGKMIIANIFAQSSQATNSQLKAKILNLSNNQNNLYSFPIPIINIETKSISSWVKFVQGVANNEMLGTILSKENLLEFYPVNDNYSSINYANRTLDSFWATASPIAQRLAVLMSAIPFNLELISLIQKHILKKPDQSYLAEVFLSGLIKKTKHIDSQNKERINYAFTPEVRKLLLDSLSIYDFKSVSEQLSAYIEDNFGRTSNFLTYIEDLNSLNKIEINENTKPFIGITVEVLKRLGIKHNEIANRLEQQIQVFERPSNNQTDKIVLDPTTDIAIIVSTNYNKIFPSFNPHQYFSIQIGKDISLPITNFAWSPNGSWLTIICGNSICNLLDLSTMQIIWTTTLEEHITAVCWLSNNDLLVLGTHKGNIYLLQTQTGATERMLSGHTDKIYSLQCMTRDKTNYYLFSCSADKTIRQWDTMSYETKHISQWSIPDLETIAWTPNWDTFASISKDAEIKVWHRDFDTWYNYKKYSSSTYVTWSLDNKRIVLGLLNTNLAIIPFPDEKPEEEVFFKGHNKRITSIAISPNNKFLASKSLDNTIRIWSVDSQKQLLEIKTQTIEQSLSPDLLFHPHLSILAFLSDANTNLQVVNLDIQEIQDPIHSLFLEDVDIGTKIKDMAQIEIDRVTKLIITILKKKEISTFAQRRSADILTTIAVRDTDQGRYYTAIKLLNFSINAYKKLTSLSRTNGGDNLQNNLAIARMNKGNTLQQLGNLSKALVYHKNAIKILKIAIRSNFLGSARNLIAALSNQGNTLSALGRFNEAISHFKEAENVFSLLLSKNKTKELIKDAAWLFNNIGETLRQMELCFDAITYYDQAINLLMENELDPKLSGVLMNKGIALTSLRRFSESIDSLNKSIDLFKKLMEKDKTYELESGFVLALINKGVALGESKKLIEAMSCYDEARILLESLIEAGGHYELENDLASTLNNKGTILNQLDQPQEAIKLYNEALKIRKKLVEKENRQDLVNDLASVIINKGVALTNFGSLEQAIICYDEAIDLYSKLINQQGRKDLENTLAKAFVSKADTLYSLGQFQEFLTYYNKAISIRENLVAKGQIRARELAILLTNKGVALTKRSLIHEAFICHEQAVNYLETSLDKADSESKEYFVKSLIPKGETLIHLGKFTEAIDCYEQVIEILNDLLLTDFKVTNLFLETLKAESISNTILNKLESLKTEQGVKQNNLLSEMRERFGDEETTKLQLLIAKYDETKEKKELLYYLAMALRNRGTAQRELKLFSDAIKSYDKGIFICKAIEHDSYEAAKIMAEILNNKANALFQQNLPSEALKCFETSIVLCRSLLEKTDYDETINLTMSLVNKGIALLLHFKNFEEAKPCFEEAITWREKAVKLGRDDFLPELISAIRYQIITLAILNNFKEIGKLLNRIKEHFTPNANPNVVPNHLLKELNELKNVLHTLPDQHFYKEFYTFLDKQIGLYS